MSGLLPTELTPEDALRLCDLLEALHTAIWRAHGTAMNLHLDGLEARHEALSEDDPI